MPVLNVLFPKLSPGLWLLLSAGLALRGTIAYFLPPGFDEAYYFLYTRNLDWSYFDHPAAVAVSTGAGVWITGIASPFTIRLGALGLYTLSLWLLYGTSLWLFGQRAAGITLVVASFSPLFMLTFGTLAAPDNPLIFFWTLAVALAAQEFFPPASRSPTDRSPAERTAYLEYRPTARIAVIGVVIGLCCLSKYHGCLLGLSLLGFCLSSPRYRCALRSQWFALGLALCGIMLLPIFIWNAEHNWISFQFQLSDRFDGQARSYSFLQVLGSFAAGIGFLFPTFGLPLWFTSLHAAWSQLSIRHSTRPLTHDKVKWVLWVGLPVAAGFTLLSGLIHTYPAWPAPGLWSLTLLLGHRAATWPIKAIWRWLSSTGVIVVLLLFALSHVTLGTLQNPSQYAIAGGILPPAQDPSTELIDTRQLQSALEQSEAFRTATSQIGFLLTHEFWLSGYVAMSLPPSEQTLPVATFSEDPRGHAIWDTPAQWLGQDAVFVSLSDFPQTEVLAAIAPYFQSVTELTQIQLRRGEAVIKTLYLYKAKQLLQAYPYPY